MVNIPADEHSGSKAAPTVNHEPQKSMQSSVQNAVTTVEPLKFFTPQHEPASLQKKRAAVSRSGKRENASSHSRSDTSSRILPSASPSPPTKNAGPSGATELDLPRRASSLAVMVC